MSAELVNALSQYGAYHRSRRNILTHFAGIPLIVYAVMVLLCKAYVQLPSLQLSALWLAVFLSCLYYFRLDWRAGLLMLAAFAPLAFLAGFSALLPLGRWLALGVGSFAVGWALQFWGHHFEGRKPAFVDDLRGLIIGPLFVAVEALFLLGAWKSLEHAITAKIGPTRA